MIVGDELQIASFTAGDQFSDEFFKGSPRPTLAGSPFLTKVILECRPHFVSDTEADTEIGAAARDRARARGFRSFLAVPLVRRGKTVGVIFISRREAGAFTDDEIGFVKTFADQAVIAHREHAAL
jgi:GAF domain-containing protein